jgi:antibiotic biosynthesis monooxygenase (ABM) superfamily enzyme
MARAGVLAGSRRDLAAVFVKKLVKKRVPSLGWSFSGAWGLIAPRCGDILGAFLVKDYVEEDARPVPGEDPPVTGVASRRVKRGREREFEEWTAGILAAANGFPGYLGSEVLRPGDDPGDDEYRIVFRFDQASNMRAWETSEERRRWLKRARPLIHEEKVNVLTGLETWFTRPSRPGEPAPPRYKMVAVTWLAVYPLITVILVLFGPLLGLLPMLLRTLVLTALMVTLMTYVIMPRMTRLFSFWLYPDRE